MSTISDFSIPGGPPDSPGSSVSTRLQDEYDELLKFAVVVPKYDPFSTQQTLADVRESFSQRAQYKETLISVARERVEDEDSDLTPIVVRVSEQETSLPDFGGHSPITVETKAKVTETKQAPTPTYSPRVTKGNPRIENMDCNNSYSGEREYEKVYTATVDPDIAKMENMMDQWCLDLKRNVLAEFSQSKIKIVETGRMQLIKEQERHASEKTSMLKEMDGLKELLHTYEKSIERKDQVISNLTHAMQKQKEKQEMLKKFCDWKVKHNDRKREEFCTNLARRHHQRQISQKVWDAWHGIIETKWRTRIERACQNKAQEVCLQLTNDYDSKISSLNEALEAGRMEVSKLHKEREHYEEMMKKAFMRGVCALNLEAMTMFQGNDDEGAEQKDSHVQNGRTSSHDDFADNMNGSLPEKDFTSGKTLPSDPCMGQFISPRDAPTARDNLAPRVVTSQGARPFSTTSITQAKTQISKSGTTKGKTMTARVTAKVDTGRQGIPSGGPLAPPMSSVIVERHQPITKQTMSHAVAGKFPRPSSSSSRSSVDSRSGISHRKIAGQGSLSVNPNIQTVKVVD